MTNEELARKRAEHLDKLLTRQRKLEEEACLHDACTECWGTGVKLDGSTCIHMISCPCPKHRWR